MPNPPKQQSNSGIDQLTQADVDWMKKKIQAMKTCHEKEFVRNLEPEMLRMFYHGRNRKQAELGNEGNEFGNGKQSYSTRQHFITLTRCFPAINTLLPNLYYQNPAPIVTGTRGADKDSAALMSAIIKWYMKHNNAKQQNQEAVLNAWWFGIGWKKIGYRTTFMPRVEEPETKLGPLEMMSQGIKSVMGVMPDNNEAKDTPDIVDYEELFNTSENPMHVMLDDKADLMNATCILHRLPRTLHDLQLFGDYDEEALKELSDKMKYERGSRMDPRDVELTLNELHIRNRNGVWIYTDVDNFNKPLRYKQSTYQGKGFCFKPLVFTNEPGVRYPTSHMKVATQVQEHLDYLATLYIRILDKMRNQLIIDETSLTPGQKKSIEANLLGGVIYTQKPVGAGTFAHIQSAAVQNDLPQLMQYLMQNITEITGGDSQQISGTSKNKTLGQDELARVGTKMRESGMQDRVRDWMIEQFRTEAILLKEYSNAELHINITGKDYVDQKTGQMAEEKWVAFGTGPESIPPDMASNPNFHFTPMGAKEYLQGEFDFDCNIYEAMKPDKQSKQNEYAEALKVFSNPLIQNAMLMDGKKVHIGKLGEGLAEQFEFLKSSEFIEDLDSMQAAAAQVQAMMMQNPGMAMPKTTPVPQNKGPQPSGAPPAGGQDDKSAQGVTAPSSGMAQL